MSKKIQVIAFEKEKNRTTMKLKEIQHDLESIHQEVGGYFEVTMAVPDGDPDGVGLLMILNEEGKFKKLPPTIAYVKDGSVIDFVAGNAFITRRDGEDFGSVTEDDFRYIQTRYHSHAVLNAEDAPHHVIVFDGNIKRF